MMKDAADHIKELESYTNYQSRVAEMKLKHNVPAHLYQASSRRMLANRGLSLVFSCGIAGCLRSFSLVHGGMGPLSLVFRPFRGLQEEVRSHREAVQQPNPRFSPIYLLYALRKVTCRRALVNVNSARDCLVPVPYLIKSDAPRSVY